MGTREYILGKVLQAVLTLAFVLVFNFFLFRVLRVIRPPCSFEAPAPSAPRTSRRFGRTSDWTSRCCGSSSTSATRRVQLRRVLLLPGRAGVGSDREQDLADIPVARNRDDRLGGDRPHHRDHGGWRHGGSRFDVASLNVTLFFFAMPEFWFGIRC